MNPSLLRDGEARANLILYLGVPKIFRCQRVSKEWGTGSPVAELAWLILPLQALSVALSWLTPMAWSIGLQGISLLSMVISCLCFKGREGEVKTWSGTCHKRTGGKAEVKMSVSHAVDKVPRKWPWIHQLLWKSGKYQRPLKRMTDLLKSQREIILAQWSWQRHWK